MLEAMSIRPALNQINAIILGKERQIRLALACLLARGHLLIEDVPGVGKTTLAHTLARTLGLDFHRIQFTSDLLPADILGVAVYQRETGGFTFHPGPIFAQVVLADEINRASPKAQSALLEAMEERQVSIEGETRPLPEPFFVIATQNPTEQVGVFPLPESQLDRFLMRIHLGYPDPGAERALLQGSDRRDMIERMGAAISPAAFVELQRATRAVKVSEALLDYLQALVDATRNDEHFAQGLSPRAGLALKHAAQAWAFLDGRDYVIPEDVQAIFPAVAAHRLADRQGMRRGDESAKRVLAAVAIP
jgi:MoxR-like ATPase